MTFDIDFQGVTFYYEGSNIPALKDINLSIKQGEIVLVTGPAGSGKTTLCSCINGLVPHFHEGNLQGNVLVRSYNTKKARIGGLASLVGMVFQDPESQLVTSSVADEVAFGPENFGVERDEINKRVKAALEATRLGGYEEREPYNLSGGEQQACVIASVYALQPDIYVMDEPLANLDPSGRAQVLRLIIEVAKKRGKTLVIVEHALEEVIPLVDRIVVMYQGEIIRDGTVEEALSLGDIPQVFTRPPIVRLSEKFLNTVQPLTPEDFYKKLSNKYQLGTIQANSPIDHAPLLAIDRKPIIEVKNVSYSYTQSKEALRNISLTIGEGELVAILGRNGSGKTTLVRHLIGLIKPVENKIFVNGKDVALTPTHELAQDVGFCFQNPNHQIVTFKVRDEVIFGLRAHKVPLSEYEERIHEALKIVDMLDYIDAEVFDLGKGQKQRLALASVLALKPRILVIDEPTTGQDPQMAEGIFNIIKNLNAMGTTVLMITHQMEYAATYAQRAIVLRSGEITFDGPINELIANRKLMEDNYLDLPEVTKIAGQFGEHGVPAWLVKIDDMTLNIQNLLSKAN
jgi:energy-coupling factor transporter ATP-binding protein EcfA2